MHVGLLTHAILLSSACPNTIPSSFMCLNVKHSITLTTPADDDGLSTEQFLSFLDAAISIGRLQSVLNKVNPNSSVYIAKVLTPVPTLPPLTPVPTLPPLTQAPVTVEPTTAAPVAPRPVTTAPSAEEISCDEVSLITTSLSIEFFGNPDEGSREELTALSKLSKIPSMVSMG